MAYCRTRAPLLEDPSSAHCFNGHGTQTAEILGAISSGKGDCSAADIMSSDGASAGVCSGGECACLCARGGISSGKGDDSTAASVSSGCIRSIPRPYRALEQA